MGKKKKKTPWYKQPWLNLLPLCHLRGNSAVLSLGDGTLYAGGTSRGANYKQKGLMVVDLTGSTRRNAEYDIQALDNIASAGFPNVVSSLSKIPNPAGILHFFIQDMSVPAWDKGYWNLLTMDIRNLLIEGTDVLVMCVGGHGRTGLALSIICHKLNSKLLGNDPVSWLRKQYCKEILETQEQIDYVFSVLELGPSPVHLEPAGLLDGYTKYLDPKYGYDFGPAYDKVPATSDLIPFDEPSRTKDWWEEELRKNW